MITVAGEALMDVIVEDSGELTALPGGAPFNVARAVARLGCECTFLGTLSDDLLGERLRAALISAGVTLGVPRPSAAPTTLALAALDASGSARYSFYLEGTSAAGLLASDIPAGLLECSHTLALGGLGIVIEPTGSTLLQAISRISPETVVIVDTIGAGDAFVAGFLSWWRLRGLGRSELADLDLLASAAAAAIEVSRADCTVPGADLPEDFRWSAAAR